MEGTAAISKSQKDRALLARLSAWCLDNLNRRTRFHYPERYAVFWRRKISCRTVKAHQGGLGKTATLFPRGAKNRSPRR